MPTADELPPVSTSASQGEIMVAVTLARIEGKIDRMSDRIAGLDFDSADHETRLRTIEGKPYVTTRMMASWVITAAALASIVPIANAISIH